MPQSQSVTILLIANDADGGESLEQTLRHAHIVNPLMIVYDAQEALEYLVQPADGVGYASALPGLLVLDLSRPSGDGLHVLARLQTDHRSKALPMLVLASTDDHRDVEQVTRGLHPIWVTTPVTAVRFAEAIGRLGLSLTVVTGSADTLS